MLRTILLFAALVLITPAIAFCTNHALLVVVEKYQSVPDINSIEMDVQNAKHLMELIGFQDDQIQTLRGSPRKADIVRSMKSWLLDQTSPGDRVAFYFSGHGTQIKDLNGDEEDGLDEALAPADYHALDAENHADPSVTLIDDELNDFLKQLAGREVAMFFDSCHSGSITKGLSKGTKTQAKLIVNQDMLDARAAGKTSKGVSMLEDAEIPATKFVEVAAAESDQISWSLVGRGGVFTLLNVEALSANSADTNHDGKITIEELKEYVDRRDGELAASDPSVKPQTMNLQGSSSLFASNMLNFAGTSQIAAAPPKDFEEEMDSVMNKSEFKVWFDDTADSYKYRDSISFLVKTNERGYLSLVSLEPDGSLLLILPNKYNPIDLSVQGGIKVPQGVTKAFKYTAGAPPGVSTVYAIVTDKPLKLYELDGQLEGIYKKFTGQSMKALRGIIIEGLDSSEPEDGSNGNESANGSNGNGSDDTNNGSNHSAYRYGMSKIKIKIFE